MSDKSRDSSDTDANGFGVRENADNIRVLASEADWNFPVRWKSLCLKILQDYKELRRKELEYRRLGWTKIRDEIMEPVDSYDRAGRRERDDRLTRQDLEAWERGVDISDEKFRFIEVFIRALQLNSDFEFLFDRLQIEDEKRKMKALADLYLPSDRREKLIEEFRGNVPHISISDELEGLWLKNIIVQIQFEYDGVLKAIFAYSPHALEYLNHSNCNDLVIYEGYLIPLLISRRQTQRLELRCIVKLVRPEFRGNIGFGYADGELHLVMSYGPKNAYLFSKSMLIDYPNHILSPALDVIQPDRRLDEDLLMKTFSDSYRHDHPLESFQNLGPDLVSGPNNYEPQDTRYPSQSGKYAQNFYRFSEVRLRQRPDDSEKLSEIMRTVYRGYTF